MLDLTQRLLEAAQGGEPVVVASVLEPGPTELAPGSRLLVERDGRRLGTLGSTELDDLFAAHAEGMFARHAAETLYVTENGLTDRTAPGATSIYAEVLESKPAFVVVGAGHIGRSLAKLADFLDFHVVVIDDREDFADPERLPEADQVICGEYEAALDGLPINANTSIVMVTRGHKQDELALRHALGRGAGYVGMIGSKRRTSAVLEHLKADGFDPEELGRVRTPIGLDIGAETPEEIAIAILAEVILLRRGGSATPMYWRRGRSAGDGT
ncbi:MAG: XdhC family protein [Tepidiformaceae bacterium]